MPEPDLVSMVAEQLGMPGVDLSRTGIDLDVLDSIPRIVAESDVVLPAHGRHGELEAVSLKGQLEVGGGKSWPIARRKAPVTLGGTQRFEQLVDAGGPPQEH